MPPVNSDQPALSGHDVRAAARACGFPLAGTMSAEEIAGLTAAEFERLAAGMALVRAQYDGLRRNAVLALGAGRREGARALIERLTGDASPLVAEAARWSLARLG
jgi:epoxyqueuosine reductase QueG